ncbi:MAG TPA: metallophosphoesterase family protein, partial [Ferruginibacter sp.]|nr:metallophosphoesterase family protein [Ferruginibacter sp.]
MKSIGILSDTHGYLDKTIGEHFAKCDEIWHAGDFGENVAEELKQLKPLKAVFGNIDGSSIRN